MVKKKEYILAGNFVDGLFAEKFVYFAESLVELGQYEGHKGDEVNGAP